MSFLANLVLGIGPDTKGGSVDDTFTLNLSGNPSVVQWYVAVGAVSGQPAEFQLTPLSGLPTAHGSIVPRTAVQQAILNAAPQGLMFGPVSVWVRADDDATISNAGDTTPGSFGTFSAATPGGTQVLSVMRNDGADAANPNDDMFQLNLAGGVAWDYRFDVLLKPASGAGSFTLLQNAATRQVPLNNGTPVASVQYSAAEILGAISQKYASVYANPGPNDPVVAGFRVSAIGGPQIDKFAIAQFDVLADNPQEPAGSVYTFGAPLFSNGGTVLDRTDDKISLSVSVNGNLADAGNAPLFRVAPLVKVAGTPVDFVANTDHTVFTLAAAPVTATPLVRLSVKSGYNTLSQVEVGLPADQPVTAASIAQAFAQSGAPKSPITSIAASGSSLVVTLQTGAPSDATLELTPVSFQRSSGFSDDLEAASQVLADTVVGIEVVEGKYSQYSPDSVPVAGVAEVQKIELPSVVQAGVKYALMLEYSKIVFTTVEGSHAGLLAALSEAATAAYAPAEFSLGTGDDAGQLLVTFKYDGAQKPVQFGKVVPLLPVYNDSTQSFDLSRPSVEASMKFMGVSLVDALEVQAVAAGSSPNEPWAVTLVPLPPLRVVESVSLADSSSGYSFSESSSDPVFNVKLTQPLSTGEQLLYRVVPPEYPNPMSALAASDDFDLPLVDGVPQGTVTFPNAASLMGSFTLPIKADSLAEPQETFEIEIGHLEAGLFVADQRHPYLMIESETGGGNPGGGGGTPSGDLPVVTFFSPPWSGQGTADNLADDKLMLQVQGTDIAGRSSYAVEVITQVNLRTPTGVATVTQEGDASHAESVRLPLPASNLGGYGYALRIGDQELGDYLGYGGTAADLASSLNSLASSAGLPVSISFVPPVTGSTAYSLDVMWNAVGAQNQAVSLFQISAVNGPQLFLRAGNPAPATLITDGSVTTTEVQRFSLSGPIALQPDTFYGLSIPHGPLLVAKTDNSPNISEVVAALLQQVPPGSPALLTQSADALTLTWSKAGAVEGLASFGALSPLTADATGAILRTELIDAIKVSQVHDLVGLNIQVHELSDSDGTQESASVMAPLPPRLVSYLQGPTQATEGETLTFTVNFDTPISIDSQIWWQAEPAPGMGAGFAKSDLQGVFSTDWPRGLVVLTPLSTDATKTSSGQITLTVAQDNVTEVAEGFQVAVGVLSNSAFIADGYPYPVLIGTAPAADATAPLSRGVSFSNTAAGSATKSVITLNFSEAVGINGSGSPTSAEVAAFIPTLVIEADVSQSGNSYQNGTPVGILGVEGFGTSTLTIATNANLQSQSVIRVKFEEGNGSVKLTDLANNPFPKSEVWAGSSANSNIQLNEYFAGSPLTIRGNSGDDVVQGTRTHDKLVDGAGADTLNGDAGQDFIVLTEHDLVSGTGTFSRDVIEISLGQSVNGGNGSRRDIIQPSGTHPSSSGFDMVSADPSKHDVLSLPSAVIAPNTSGDMDGVDNTNSGSAITIGTHSISNGIITFKNAAGVPYLLQSSQQVTDAMEYLANNFTLASGSPGRTVAFHYDGDANGVADSLFIYQQPGRAQAGLTAGETMPATSLLIHDLIGVANAKLGTVAGPNVVQIVDTQMPQPIQVGLIKTAANIMQVGIDFAEAVTVAGSGGFVFKVNGATPVAGSLASTSGPSQVRVDLPATVSADDWVLLSVASVVAGQNAISDAAGNVLEPGDGDVWSGLALGGAAANTINLSDVAQFPASGEYDIEGGGGNDTLLGSAGSDYIRGGTGADSITGGAGDDSISFAQGDSPAITATLSGGVVVSFNFGVSQPDVVTDFSSGDRIEISVPFAEMKNVGGLAPTPAVSPGQLQGVMPANGLAPDQQFFVVRGSLASNSVFSVSQDGSDTLVVYDGSVNGQTSAVSQTGFVLKNVIPSQLGTYAGGIERIDGGGVTPPPPPPAADSPPTNTWLSFTEPTSGSANSTLIFRLSEPFGINGDMTPSEAWVDAWRDTLRVDLNPPQEGASPGNSSSVVSGTRLQVSAVTGFASSGNTSELVLTTDRTLGASDVVRVIFPRDAQSAQHTLTDAGSNPYVGVEIWAGGSAATTIDLQSYFSDRTVWVRGNSGNDTLVGTRAADWLIDGLGADTLEGGRGGDVLILAESGTFGRDTVRIGWGESVASLSGNLRDVIAPGATQGSGFDIVSGVTTQDVLSLPSSLIAAATSGFVSGVSNTNQDRSVTITSHQISAGGIVSFKDGAANNVLPSNSQQVSDAVFYLSQTVQQAGATVAFAYDRDQSGTADSLVIFQQGAWVSAGLTPSESYRLAPTLVIVRDLVGLDEATLGEAAGNKVVQIVDQLAPEVASVALSHGATNLVEINFAEAINVTGTAGVALKRQGVDPLAFTATKHADSSVRLTITSPLSSTDWVLLDIDDSTTGNSVSDLAGNRLIDGDGSRGGVAIGGAGNDVINLSGSQFSATQFFDVMGGAGNDVLVGSAGENVLHGGRGADTVSGGGGLDDFELVQGDSPTVTVALLANKPATFSFTGGADVITDLAVGEGVQLRLPHQDLRGLDGLRPMGESFLALSGQMPDNGLVTDQGFFIVRGVLSDSAGPAVFSVSDGAGPDTLIVYDGATGSAVSQTGVVLRGVTPAELNTFIGGVSRRSEPDGNQGDDTVRGTDGPDTLDGAGTEDRILIGAGGNDLGQGLTEGDVFIGGAGTDTAQLQGSAADYVVKLASPALRATVKALSPDTFSDHQPVFAVQSTASPSGVVLLQAESLRFGAAAPVDPMTLVLGGALVVNSQSNGALPSISSAIAAAADGATIYVSATHVDPSEALPIIVTRNNLHIILEANPSESVTFQLAESEAVRNLYLFGSGAASMIGNSYDNVLVGNAGPNAIDGRGGNDSVLGEGGSDELFGGAGHDWLDGGDGFDRLFGGSGNDTLLSTPEHHGGGGAHPASEGDVMLGGSGNDLLIAMQGGTDAGPVRMLGGSGADVFRIASGNGADGTPENAGGAAGEFVRAFIADLTAADGLDLSALRTSAAGTGVLQALPAGSTVSGDYQIPLGGLYLAGLQQVGLAEGTPQAAAPVDPIAAGSSISFALAGQAEVAAASVRSIPVPTMQALAEQVVPVVYRPLEAFEEQLYF